MYFICYNFARKTTPVFFFLSIDLTSCLVWLNVFLQSTIFSFKIQFSSNGCYICLPGHSI